MTKDWEVFKSHTCKQGESLNLLLLATGHEIIVEQFGIRGYLDKVKNNTYEEKSKKNIPIYRCALIDAEKTGTGKFGEWLESVKYFCKREGGIFAVTNVTNGRLWKYFKNHEIPYVQDGVLYEVHLNQDNVSIS